MNEWAKREIELACRREHGDKNPDEWDYGITKTVRNGTDIRGDVFYE